MPGFFCCYFSFLQLGALFFFLCLQPVERLPALCLPQGALCQYGGIVAGIGLADILEGGLLPFQLLDGQAGLFHVFQRLGQRAEVFIGEGGQGLVEDFVDDAGLEVAGELGTAQLYEQLHQFLVLADVLIAEDILVHHGHVFPLLRGDPAVLADGVFQFPAGERSFLLRPGLGIFGQTVEEKVFSDAAAVLQDEAPEIHLGGAAAGVEADAGGDVLVAVFPLVFQIEVACAFIVAADFLLSQQVIVHGAGLGAETVQAVSPLHTVQQHGDQALHGDGFAGAVAAPQQQASSCEIKFRFIIIPVVQNAGPVGLPAVVAHLSFSLLYSWG